MRKLVTLLAALALAAAAVPMSAVGSPARDRGGVQSNQKKVCGDDARDHGDCGKGNAGDPGNGGGHQNESNGKGNDGDPGKYGRGHRN
jgi:hypothetical protein